MSMLSELVHKIMGDRPAPAAAAGTPSWKPDAAAAPSVTKASTTSTTAAPAPAGAATGAQVDIAKVLGDMAAKNSEKLDWKRSIVDLMKLVGIDSSLAARKELAKDLAYTGDTNDSATMNVWLHKQVMARLAASGGKVPDDLKA